jgi:hypothetical protein
LWINLDCTNHLHDRPSFGSDRKTREKVRVAKVKKVIAILALAISMLLVSGTAAYAGGPCSPGQHGNPSPGFKPPSCPHN